MSLDLDVEGPPPSVLAIACSIASLPALSLSIIGQDHSRLRLMSQLTLYRFLQKHSFAKVLQGCQKLFGP